MNANSILLAYASRYGSTQEVAESIAAALRHVGLKVDMRPMQDVKGLDQSDAIVLGAAIYNGKWHPDAHDFLSRHQKAIGQRPVAVFALGPLSTSEAAMRRSRGQLERELGKYPWLEPVAVEVFVGKLDPSKLGLFERLGSTASDRRNWDAIRAWADSLPAQLQHDEVTSPAR